MKEAIRLRMGEIEEGPFDLDRIFRMAKRGEILEGALFWSARLERWLPLRGVLFDLYPDRVAQMREHHVKRVRALHSGTGEDCAACLALAERVFEIDQAPEMPPAGCTCFPWCRCVIVATR